MKSRFIVYLIMACSLLFPVLSRSSSNNFLVISDIHLNSSGRPMEISPAKPNGSNDLDSGTLTRLISIIKQNIQSGLVARPDFIVLLGDLVGHQRLTSQSAVTAEATVFTLLKNTFSDTPIFYTVGNNDSLMADYGPFTDPGRTAEPKSPYKVATLKSNWSDGFLSTGTICKIPASTFPCVIPESSDYMMSGYYSAYLKPGFRLISLNSVLFSPSRVNISDNDAMKELTWFGGELKQAQQNKESVLIVMHIPPGNNTYDNSRFWLPEEQTVFLQLIKNNSTIIAGILTSHTHAEELKIIKNIGVGVYFTAALSTSHGNAPSTKTFYYASTNGKWQLSNASTFGFSQVDSKLKFDKIYDYKAIYCKGQEISLSDCLNDVTSVEMNKFFSVKNPNFPGNMTFPDDIYINVN